MGEETLPAGWYGNSLGGPGLGLEYLREDLRLRAPLLDDPLIVMAGPLTGLPLPAAAAAAALHFDKSETRLRIWSIPGAWPVFLKLAGYDGLVISGRSTAPVRLSVRANQAGIADASGLWGRDIPQTEAGLRGKPRGSGQPVHRPGR